MLQTDVENALNIFRHDVVNNYFVVEVTKDLLERAIVLAIKHALRGYDAVQLATALETNDERIKEGLSTIILVSADKELNDAATVEGLLVEDPNDFP